tara:strand:- start:231 stop:530 length:300 start_codon:yes stop_codon:yes gene_type:complete
VYKYYKQRKIMPKTNHFISRIQQRGILQSTIDMAQRYGLPKGDKFILGKKQIDSAIKKLDEERKNLIKARDQGGVVAVEAEGVLITAYRLDSFRRKLAQ